MNLSFQSIARLVNFLEQLETETYPEEPSPLHTQLTTMAMSHLFDHYPVPPGAKVLDVGCGQGVALELFAKRNCQPVGVTLNETDVAACRGLGYNVTKMDQSFLDFADATFDLVWARHVVEHSIFPYFTISEFRRVLRPGGMLYLEVPGTETTCRHELNRNHYSIMSQTMWQSLLSRAGFIPQEAQNYSLKCESGPDEYWAFFCVTTPQSS